MWFLIAAAIGGLLFFLLMLIRRAVTSREDDWEVEDGTEASIPPALAAKVSQPPDERIDFEDLVPGDIVHATTASGSHYRFTMVDRPGRLFDVMRSGGRRPPLRFRAVVTGSHGDDRVFESTFAVGCRLNVLVLEGEGLRERRTRTVVRVLRDVSTGDKKNSAE